jgi:hypothetical protein
VIRMGLEPMTPTLKVLYINVLFVGCYNPVYHR